jgi:hypothetical protein
MAAKKIDWNKLPWGFIAFVVYVLALQGLVGQWIMQMVTGA